MATEIRFLRILIFLIFLNFNGSRECYAAFPVYQMQCDKFAISDLADSFVKKSQTSFAHHPAKVLPDKKRWVAALLAVPPIGIFGLHWLYLQKPERSIKFFALLLISGLSLIYFAINSFTTGIMFLVIAAYLIIWSLIFSLADFAHIATAQTDAKMYDRPWFYKYWWILLLIL